MKDLGFRLDPKSKTVSLQEKREGDLKWGVMGGKGHVEMEVMIGGCVYNPGGTREGGATGREGRGVTDPPRSLQKNQPCRHLVFCSGLQNIERMDFGCFKPLQCVVLCFVTEPQESNTGAPLSCRQRLRCWSPPRQLLGRHPPGPHHGQR